MNVVEIRLAESARQDAWRLLGSGHAPERTDDLTAVLDGIAAGMNRVLDGWQASDPDLLRRASARVGQEASALGLNRIARVARTVELLAGQDDRHALAANVARLLRLGNGLYEEAAQICDRPG